MAVSLRKPVCVVLTPFGVKTHPETGAEIDFDSIYDEVVRPAIHFAGMSPVRLDQQIAGLRESTARETVMNADFAVADITTRDPSILFLLGARAERLPGTVVVLASRGLEGRLSGLSGVQVLTYDVDEGTRLSYRESSRLRKTLSAALSEARGARKPEEADASAAAATVLAGVAVALAAAIEQARDKRDLPELKRLQGEVTQQSTDPTLLLNVFQAYTALGDWKSVVDLFAEFPEELRTLPRVRQQAALALSRLGRQPEAVAMLQDLLKEQGQSDPETLNLLGSVYKDFYFQFKDPAALDRAIEYYVEGFNANRRDAYPGINALRLLELRGDDQSLEAKNALLPFVGAAVLDQRKSAPRPNYWDYATDLELAVLAGDEVRARECLAAALASRLESWQAEATADNLDLIRSARAGRGIVQPWLDETVSALHSALPA